MKTLNVIIISFAIILTGIILVLPIRKHIKKSDSITVSGLAKKDFVSDMIVWNGFFQQKAPTMKEAYAKLKKDAETIKKYLISKGAKEEEIVFSSVALDKEFKTTVQKEGSSTQEFVGYMLNQSVTIESKDVEKIEIISRESTELIDMGVEFRSSQPQYFYTKLSELKLEMLAEATRDAKARAEKIAQNAGSSIGDLKLANQGIFQITAQNSDENFSWGGTYNTASKNKTATVTVKLQFAVKSSWFSF